MLLRVVLFALLCMAVFVPIASADSATATPVDAAEDAQLQELDAQTSQTVEDIQGGLSKAWGIVGVVLVAIIALSLIL